MEDVRFVKSHSSEQYFWIHVSVKCALFCVSDEARLNKQGVLVHCLAGISRSVTVTVAYLMSKQSMCLNEAYDFVKKCKPNISPNFTFMGQLLDFEKALHHKNHCGCSAHQSDDDDGVPPSDSDSDKTSPPFQNSPLWKKSLK